MGKKNLKFLSVIVSAILLVIGAWSLTKGSVPFSAHKPYKENTYKENYKWNLQDIYQQEKDWYKDFALLTNDYKQIDKFKGKLKDEDILIKCLQLTEDLSRKLEKLYLYARLRVDQNQTDNTASEMLSKIESISSEVSARSAFIQPEIMEQPEKTIKEYLGSVKFKNYQHFFEVLLQQKEHLLSKEEEYLLGMSQELAFTPKSTYDKLTLADMNFPKIRDPEGREIQLSPATYEKILSNSNRDFRKKGYQGIMNTYNSNKYTLAALLNGQVKKDVFYAKARKYPSALEAALAEDNIPPEVYTNLVKSVNKSLKTLHKYVDIRKRALKIDKVHDFDFFVPLAGKYDDSIKYTDAQKKVIEGLKPLGAQYTADLQKAFNSGWIDVYPAENKYTGNYNTGAYDSHSYILLNFNNNFDSMLTLAHEAGHALHTHYSNQGQPYTNADVSIFTSEVAAAVNEMLMFEYLLKNAQDDQEKLYLLNKIIENIRGSVFTQVMFAEFEQAIHEKVEQGEALTLETINALWAELRSKYFGANYALDELGPIGWSRIPHFYMNFYVFKYATSIAAASVIVQDISSGDKEALKRYHDFLRSGSSDYPLKLLKVAGVDMNSAQPIEDTLTYFENLVNRFEMLLEKEGKIKSKK